MHKPICALTAWVFLWPCASVRAQTVQQELLQKLATVKESVARNQAALREFTWTQRTVTSEKGEIRRTKIATCYFRPDDQLQRTLVSESERPPTGLKEKIFELKSVALESYERRLLALREQYLPPSLRLMTAAYQAGNVALGPAGPGTITLNFKTFVLSGDSLIFDFNSAARSLRKIFVKTYLGDPKDPVTLLASFATLPDGANYVSSTTLEEKAKGIQITIQNSGYKKIEQ
jgi:hypothetical protein